METFNQFEKHLKSVCKNKELREIAIQYYHDLGKHMEGVTYTKDDFETITYNGEIVEQDIVKDLFSKQESATAQEVFTYLFKTKVQYLFGYKSKERSGVAGAYNAVGQYLNVKLLPSEAFYRRPELAVFSYITEGKSLKQAKKERSQLIKQSVESAFQKAEFERSDDLKSNLYHELSHVFETSSFLDGKVTKTGFKEEYAVKHKKGGVYCQESELSNSGIKQSVQEEKLLQKDLKQKRVSNINKFVELIKRTGTTSLAEILNEEFSQKVKGLIKEASGCVIASGFTNKKFLVGACGYNKDYDMLNYFRVSLGEETLSKNRFSSKKIVNKLNNLNLSDEFLNKFKQDTKQLIQERNNFIPNEKAITDGVCDQIDGLSTSDLIFLIIGYNSFSPSNVEGTQKCLIQSILMENYKNNTLEKLNDPEVIKDKAFFEKLNNDLEKLDDYTLYPKGYTTFKQQSYRPTILDTIRVHNPKIYSVRQYAEYEKMETATPYEAFADLIDAVKECVEQNKENIPELEETMTFLKSQEEIEQNYKNLQDSQDKALLAQKEAMLKQEEQKKDLEYGDEWL